MTKSEIVEVDGVFVGAAIQQPDSTQHRFFATHDRVRPLHGATMPSLAAIRHQAARHFRGIPNAAEAIVFSQTYAR
ncbi:hypothetical protein NFI95_14880 [Acetobacteraceae bacterium KSS8]|uniref:Uncharacterized protein n=1 Tax=Endosaccharibacter trunci TaxID=2812733 RepID=A0ABT1WA15_9PROT|nr:hypothetical protein [Acetobacteraceae bacterium KSS8]